MALSASKILSDMVSAASATAVVQWKDIKTAVTFEFRILSQRLVHIVKLHTTGQIDNDSAKMFFLMAYNNTIAAIAMGTALVAVAAKRILDAALNVVRTAVNSAIGFALV